jgi:hypothetical protein
MKNWGRFFVRSKALAIVSVSLLVLPLSGNAATLFSVTDSGWVGIGSGTTALAPLDVLGSFYSRLKSLTDGSSLTVDWSGANTQSLTLNTSNTTLTFSNGEAGGDYKLLLTQDGTGGRQITWPVSVIWSNGSAPVLTSAAGSRDLVRFTYDGTNYWGEYASTFSAPALSEWNMNGTAGSGGKEADDGTFGHALTEVGSPTATSSHLTPTSNGAYSFNGSSQYLTASDSGMPSGNGAWTVEGWVYVPSIGTNPMTLFSWGSRTGSFHMGEIDILGTSDGAGKIN